MYNRIVLVGRLTKDPDLRHTPSGKAVASFRLAVDRGRKDQHGNSETDFINIIVWERQAETVSQYLNKGRLVLVEGRLQMRTYDTQDGQRRTVYEVVANAVRFMPDGRGSQDAPSPAAPPAGDQGSGDFGYGYNPGDDDDVPF